MRQRTGPCEAYPHNQRREIMTGLGQLWNHVLREPTPDWVDPLLAKLR